MTAIRRLSTVQLHFFTRTILIMKPTRSLLFLATLSFMHLFASEALADNNKVLMLAPQATGSTDWNFYGTDYVHVPHSTDFLVPSFTVEAWVCRTATNTVKVRPAEYIFNKGGDQISGHICFFRETGFSDPRAYLKLRVNYATLSALDNSVTGQWYHVAGVFDMPRGKMSLYIDGNLAASTNMLTLASPSSTAAVRIGQHNDPISNYPWHGYIDNVRFWNYARSQAEIQTAICGIPAGAVSGLVANWVFDSGTATDISGHGHDGTLIGNAIITNRVIPQISGSNAWKMAYGSDILPIGETNAVQLSTLNSGDGGESFALGGVGALADGNMAGIEWTVSGAGLLAFDWKVSSEADYDVLRFYEVGGTTTNVISGVGGGWTRISLTVQGETNTVHTFRWEYEKDPVGDYVGEDCGWIDAITWTPLYTLTVKGSASGGSYTNGQQVLITADIPQSGYTFERWIGATQYVANVTAATTVVTMPASNISITATYCLSPVSLAAGAPVSIIGNTNAVAVVGENSGDGGTSVKLGGIGLLPDGKTTGIELTVNGSGLLAFDWKVSSEADYDWLRFYEVGVDVTNQISGVGTGWTRVFVPVNGAKDAIHTFRWEYVKDPIGDSVGEDCGWVDAISWAPFYVLAVNGGTGSGGYTNGTAVAIIADAPAAHCVFNRWIGDTNRVANVFASSTTLMMPATGVVVTATYKPILYTLSVAHGSGGGSYPYASTVEIGAAQYAGKRFYRWTGDVDTVTDVASATTTVQTADHPLSVAATYSVLLTVNGGTGDGWHVEGSTATVTADPDPMYMEFAEWTGDAAGSLDDATAPTASLPMPTSPATLTATYRASVARVTGSYGRTYLTSGTSGGISTDLGAGSPSGTAAVKLGGAGIVPDNGFVAFETVVSGSGSVTFWWKVSSESNADYLNFFVDGVQLAAISGTKVPWAQVSNRVEGADVPHTLRWEYVKNGSVASSTDAGWVDDIVWTGDVPEPVIRPDIRTMAATNNTFAFTFLGERGIPYTVYSNATLNAWGWMPMAIEPQVRGETNGVFRFEALVAQYMGLGSCFYRVCVTNAQPSPDGMVLIPGGTNTGTDPDFGAYSLTVDAFYMDATEVTKTLWEEVKNWNGGNGYSFDNVGNGKAPDHPVCMVNWYDCVKWCNARSQMNGRTPVYYTDAAMTVLYKTGQVLEPYVKSSANGYRLPTDAQWEYASRGGLAGKRFSWGDRIDHTRANYYSYWSSGNPVYSYDDGYKGYDTRFEVGSYPLSSPAGFFAPNTYGLYDMAGNVWEWCYDWHPGYVGSGRVARGGSWGDHAIYCRSVDRGKGNPGYQGASFGFRTVAFPDQQ